jgi:hypothetical protein
MVEPCHLVLGAMEGRIIMVGGSGNDVGGGKSNSSFFLM